jgi:hypothetical protein
MKKIFVISSVVLLIGLAFVQVMLIADQEPSKDEVKAEQNPPAKEPKFNERVLTDERLGVTVEASDPDYIKLLERRVELYERIAKDIDVAASISAVTASELFNSKIAFANAKAKLFYYKGESEKWIATLEEKLKAVKYIQQSVDARVKAGNGTSVNAYEAQILVAEIEFELKAAKKILEKNKLNDKPQPRREPLQTR